MADQVILLDTSILIDYFRKTIKEKTILHLLTESNYQFHFEMPLASLNVKHFTDIDDLKIYKF